MFFALIPFVNRGFGETQPFESSITQEAPRINDISFISEEGFRLSFEAAPGEYDIEFSEDLKSWSPLSSITASAGVGGFEDEAAMGQPSRFYRIQGSFTAAGYHVRVNPMRRRNRSAEIMNMILFRWIRRGGLKSPVEFPANRMLRCGCQDLPRKEAVC